MHRPARARVRARLLVLSHLVPSHLVLAHFVLSHLCAPENGPEMVMAQLVKGTVGQGHSWFNTLSTRLRSSFARFSAALGLARDLISAKPPEAKRPVLFHIQPQEATGACVHDVMHDLHEIQDAHLFSPQLLDGCRA